MASIIGEKYKGKYKGAEDWIGEVLGKHATSPVTKEQRTKVEGEEDKIETVETSKRTVNLDALFDIAEENGIKARELYGEQADRKNAPGRLRMTIGNSLRAAARKRHGLYVNGEWVDAPETFVGALPKLENPDGSKIAKAKTSEGAGSSDVITESAPEATVDVEN